jgi:hypothetical protein
MGHRRDRITRHAATSKNAGAMTRMNAEVIDVATGLMSGVASHLMSVAANRPMCAVVTDPMSVEVNGLRSDGQTRAVTGIVVADPIRAPAMAPTLCCRMVNAGLTSGAELTHPMS